MPRVKQESKIEVHPQGANCGPESAYIHGLAQAGAACDNVIRSIRWRDAESVQNQRGSAAESLNRIHKAGRLYMRIQMFLKGLSVGRVVSSP